MPRPKLPVPEDLIPLFGVLSDSKIASLAGVSAPTVRRWREDTGLRYPKVSWGLEAESEVPCPPEVVPLLGVWTVTRLSRIYRVTVHTIRVWHEAHSVPVTKKGKSNGRRGRPHKPVPPHLESQIGLIPDRSLADAAGVSPQLARRWREDKGLPPAPVVRGRRAYDEEAWKARVESRYPGIFALLGGEPDAAIGSKYGFTRELARQFRVRMDIPAFRAPVKSEAILACPKEMSTTAVAKALHTSSTRVKAVRDAHGIVTPSKYRALLDSVRHLMGTMSDRKLAAITPGLSRNVVGVERARLGIPPHSLSPRCEGFVKIDRKRARELYLEGLNDEEVAAVLGSTKLSMRAVRLQELDILFSKQHPMRLRVSTSE